MSTSGPGPLDATDHLFGCFSKHSRQLWRTLYETIGPTHKIQYHRSFPSSGDKQVSFHHPKLQGYRCRLPRKSLFYQDILDNFACGLEPCHRPTDKFWGWLPSVWQCTSFLLVLRSNGQGVKKPSILCTKFSVWVSKVFKRRLQQEGPRHDALYAA